MEKSKKEFSIIWQICMHKPMHMSLFWTITLVLTFGFWDTFASSSVVTKHSIKFLKEPMQSLSKLI